MMCKRESPSPHYSLLQPAVHPSAAAPLVFIANAPRSPHPLTLLDMIRCGLRGYNSSPLNVLLLPTQGKAEKENLLSSLPTVGDGGGGRAREKDWKRN
eukprot:scaffold267311_cov30-Tisochrysis_lutea.AAC.1